MVGTGGDKKGRDRHGAERPVGAPLPRRSVLRGAAQLGAAALFGGAAGDALRRAEDPAELSRVDAAPARGGELTYGLRDEPDRLDPNLTTFRPSQVIFFQIFDTLVVRDERDKKFKPWLATSWQASPDGRVYTFRIRPGVRFHDGAPFDAAAVKFNFDRTHDPKLATRCSACALGYYDHADVIDSSTVAIYLKGPWAPFLDATSLYYRMVSPAAVQRYGDDDFGHHPVGTGPFRFVEWVPTNHVTLERFPDYNWAPSTMKHSGPAYLDRVTFRYLPEDGTRVSTLENGETQIIDYAPPQDFARLIETRRFDPSIGLPPGVPFNFAINITKAPTDELAVRQAMSYGIDRPTICKTVFGPFQPLKAFQPAYGMLTPQTWSYDRQAGRQYQHDPAKAKALLDNAGWKPGPSGIREKNGQPLTIVLGSWLHGVPELMQSQLREVGIDLKIQIAEGSMITLVNENQRKGASHMSPLPAPRSDPDAMSGILHSRNVGGGGFNFSFVKDPELDRLLDAQATEVDERKRAALLGQAQRLVMDRMYMLPVYEQDYVYLRAGRVHDLSFAIGSFPWLYDVSLA